MTCQHAQGACAGIKSNGTSRERRRPAASQGRAGGKQAQPYTHSVQIYLTCQNTWHNQSTQAGVYGELYLRD